MLKILEYSNSMLILYPKHESFYILSNNLDFAYVFKYNTNIKINKGELIMKAKKNHSNFIKKVVENSLSANANSTSSIMFYQPKTPDALRKFSKIENDK